MQPQLGRITSLPAPSPPLRVPLLDRVKSAPTKLSQLRVQFPNLNIRNLRQGASTWETAYTLCMTVVGAGILGLPYAMQQAGWVFLPCIAIIGAFMTYTLVIIGKLLSQIDAVADQRDIPQENRDMSVVGSVAFGWKGEVIFLVLPMLDLFGAVAMFTLMSAHNLHVVVPTVPLPWVVGVVSALTFPLLFVNEDRFNVLAQVGSVAIFLILGCLALTAFELFTEDAAATDQVVLNPAGISSACGMVLMMLVAHSEAPLLYQKMEHREKWPQAAAMGMGMAISLCLVAATVGYAAFGGEAKQAFTANLGRGVDLNPLPGRFNLLFAKFCAGLMSVKLVTMQPLLMAPITNQVKEFTGWGWVPMFKFQLALVALTTCLCVALADQLAYVMELLGCILINTIAVLMPCAAYLQLQGAQMRPLKKLAIWAVIAVFSAYMVVGTGFIIVDGAEHASAHHA